MRGSKPKRQSTHCLTIVAPERAKPVCRLIPREFARPVNMAFGVYLACIRSEISRSSIVNLPLVLALIFLWPSQQQSKCSLPDATAWTEEHVVGNVRELRIEEIHYNYTTPERKLTRAVKFSREGRYLEIEQPGYLP